MKNARRECSDMAMNPSGFLAPAAVPLAVRADANSVAIFRRLQYTAHCANVGTFLQPFSP